jgi:hypothetical protein
VVNTGDTCPMANGYPCATGYCVDGICCTAPACSTSATPCSSCRYGPAPGSCNPVSSGTTQYCSGNSSCGASSAGGVWCGLNQFASCTASSQCLDGCCSAGGTYKNECGNYGSGCL